MRRGVTTNWTIVCIATLVLGLIPSPAVASSGNAGIKLQKTVDSATTAPVLALTLQVSAQQAIPGDKAVEVRG
jgi:hypothetical protein